MVVLPVVGCAPFQSPEAVQALVPYEAQVSVTGLPARICVGEMLRLGAPVGIAAKAAPACTNPAPAPCAPSAMGSGEVSGAVAICSALRAGSPCHSSAAAAATWGA